MREILPNCTTREVRGRIQIHGVSCVPVFCMNCHGHYGYTREPEPGSGYVGYLCEPCADCWSPLVGTMLVPDTAHALHRRAEMVDAYGRELTDAEALREVDDVNSKLSRILR